MPERIPAACRGTGTIAAFVGLQYAQRAVNGEGLPNARFTHY